MRTDMVALMYYHCHLADNQQWGAPGWYYCNPAYFDAVIVQCSALFLLQPNSLENDLTLNMSTFNVCSYVVQCTPGSIYHTELDNLKFGANDETGACTLCQLIVTSIFLIMCQKIMMSLFVLKKETSIRHLYACSPIPWYTNIPHLSSS
jgi:hypothetical protein